jgi:cobalt/nickel transport system permease protein
MIAEQFSAGDSFFHRLDPRVKLVLASAFSVVVATVDKTAPLLCAALLSAGLVATARLSLRRVALRLALVNGFVLFLWLSLPFTFQGETLFALGPLEASAEGVHRALLITIKSNAIIMALLALLATSPVMTLAHALNHLWVPAKLVHLSFFTYRYVHVLHAEYLSLSAALKIRCFRPRSDLHTYRTYAYLVGMLLLRSYKRSQRVYDAMVCRGFKGTFWLLDHFELRGADVAALGAGGLLVVGIAFWGLWPGA